MRTKPVLAIALASMLLLAGCSGLTGSSGNGDGAGGDYPAADSITADQIETHAAALNDTSFTTEINVTQGGQTVSSATVLVDRTDDQYLQRSTSAFGNSTLYTAGNTSYQRSQYGNQTQVARTDRSVNVTAAVRGSSTLEIFISHNVTYEQVGTETFDGDEVMRYEAEGVDKLSEEFRNSTGENLTVTDFSATLLLDGEGRVRKFSADFSFTRNGETSNTTFVTTVTDVGSTDVEEPDWVSQANATTQTQS